MSGLRLVLDADRWDQIVTRRWLSALAGPAITGRGHRAAATGAPHVMPAVPSPRPSLPTTEAVLAMTDVELVEHVAARVAGLMVKASAVADRSEYLSCLDDEVTRGRLARIDDVIFAGQRLLQRLSAV